MEVLLEILLQIFGDAIVDGLVRARNPVARTIGHAIIAGILASILAVVSLVIFPHHIISNHSLRFAALLTMPIANGFLMQSIGSYFSVRGQTRSGFEHAIPAAVFSLVFGIVRFQLAK
jgi:hypothetical protein